MKIKFLYKATQLLFITALALIIYFIASCGSTDKVEKNTLTINIYYDKDVNDGNIFYCILKADGHKAFIGANNQSLYSEYAKDDQKTLFMYINPTSSDKKVTMELKLMENQQGSLYFLFSNEISQRWKHRFDALTEDKTFNVYLKGNKISKVEEKSFSLF
ncbi:hypothetical protein AAEX28_14475 [Lentisphaerota bacterium WC36G]|nr:hypothetical protein LJT99_01230 [Lentisphaerae bacterium WC36]